MSEFYFTFTTSSGKSLNENKWWYFVCGDSMNNFKEGDSHIDFNIPIKKFAKTGIITIKHKLHIWTFKNINNIWKSDCNTSTICLTSGKWKIPLSIVKSELFEPYWKEYIEKEVNNERFFKNHNEMKIKEYINQIEQFKLNIKNEEKDIEKRDKNIKLLSEGL